MDTEHWFPAMGNNYKSDSTYYKQALYLSTGETEPFEVKIYSKETVIGTVHISKDRPAIFDIPRAHIITDNIDDKMKAVSMGLHLSGAKKYFATLRFSVINHAEIVTSKGTSALGKEFYVGMPKMTDIVGDGLKFSYMASVMATENNTIVTINNNPNITFVDGSSTSTKTFELNRGESFIFEVNNEENSYNNLSYGLIGSKIISNKPIALVNGNFSGRIVANNGVDIFMDQSIPTEKLGNEHIVVNGNGSIPSPMEKALVIATKDNTQIFINNDTTPFKTLNSGEHVFISSSSYINNPTNEKVSTLYIRSSENIYVYQMLAGVSDGSEYATGGFNLIPKLDCFLPNKIDQLGNIDSNPVYSTRSRNNIDYFTTLPTKLNIITEKGAKVKINGSELNGSFGPYPILGTDVWEVFSYPSVTGNITIESTKAVTAGIAAGNGNVGYGGYFAGFSSKPFISKINLRASGDCIDDDIRLEVENNFDTYQWFLNGEKLNGENKYYIIPKQAGKYKCEVEKINCNKDVTPEYKHLKCTVKSSQNRTIGSCNQLEINPEFSISHQSIDYKSIRIAEPPKNGRAIVLPSGLISYSVESASATDDSFSFYFQGNEEFYESELVTINLSIKRINKNNETLIECLPNGIGTYDLTSTKLSSDTDLKTILYFESKNDALDINSNNFITNPQAYQSGLKTIYARLHNAFDCIEVAEINLTTPPEPLISSIDVNNNSITIHASSGTPPYSYSWERHPEWTTENAFNNIPKGTYKAFVKDAKGCVITEKIFANLKLINTITPNGDTFNDYLDYSDLKIKEDVIIEVFDRYGKIIFQNLKGEYIWDGTAKGRPLPTDTYYYILKWTEPDTKEQKTFNNWILIKNR